MAFSMRKAKENDLFLIDNPNQRFDRLSVRPLSLSKVRQIKTDK
jgi:hypothetical protein